MKSKIFIIILMTVVACVAYGVYTKATRVVYTLHEGHMPSQGTVKVGHIKYGYDYDRWFVVGDAVFGLEPNTSLIMSNDELNINPVDDKTCEVINLTLKAETPRNQPDGIYASTVLCSETQTNKNGQWYDKRTRLADGNIVSNDDETKRFYYGKKICYKKKGDKIEVIDNENLPLASVNVREGQVAVIYAGEKEQRVFEARQGYDKRGKRTIKQYKSFKEEGIVKEGELVGVVKKEILEPFTLEYQNGGLKYTVTAQISNLTNFLIFFEKIGSYVYDSSDLAQINKYCDPYDFAAAVYHAEKADADHKWLQENYAEMLREFQNECGITIGALSVTAEP